MENNYHLLQPLDNAIYTWAQSILYKHGHTRILTVLPEPNAEDWIGDLLAETYDVSYTAIDLLGGCAGYDAVVAAGLLQRLSGIASEKIIQGLEKTVKCGGLVLITLSNQHYTDDKVLWIAEGKKIEASLKNNKDYEAHTIDVKGYNNMPSVYLVSYTV